MLGYRGNSLQLIHSRRNVNILNLWKTKQKNGENDESISPAPTMYEL